MMLADDQEEILKKARAAREQMGKGDNGMPIIVLVIRDGECVLEAFYSPGRDDLVPLIGFMTYGMGADEVILILDTFTTTEKVNPLTGDEWGKDEMGFMAANYPEALEKGWVMDAIQIIGIDRSLHQIDVNLPYKAVGDEIEWREPLIVDSANSPDYMAGDEGFYAELRQVMSRQGDVLERLDVDDSELGQKAKSEISEMPDWMLNTVRDIAVVHRLTVENAFEAIAVYAEAGSERERFLQDHSGSDAFNGYSITDLS